MWYDFAVVLILKLIVWPTLTLIDVANPWIVESPIPLTCQSLGGSPGLLFSQANRVRDRGAAQAGAGGLTGT